MNEEWRWCEDGGGHFRKMSQYMQNMHMKKLVQLTEKNKSILGYLDYRREAKDKRMTEPTGIRE